MAKISSITDYFTANALNTGLWTQFTGGGSTMVYDSTGAASVFPVATTAATDGDITSNITYDLIASVAALQVASVATGANSDNYFQLKADASNKVSFLVENGTLYAQKLVAGANTNITSVAYNSTTHAWWRFREAGGTTFWETSTDGRTWALFTSQANPITLTALTIFIGGFSFGIDVNPGTFKWLNFNLPPTDSSYSIRITNRYVGPMAMRHNYHQPINTYSAVVVGIAYTQGLTATLSFVGAKVNRTNKPLTAGLTFIGTISRRVLRSLAAALSFVGVFRKFITNIPFTAALSFTGTLAAAHRFTQALTAMLSFVGSVARLNKHSFTATLSFVGSIFKASVRSLTAALTFIGTLRKKTLKALAGALTFIGALARNQSLHVLLTASLSFVTFFRTFIAPKFVFITKIINSITPNKTVEDTAPLANVDSSAMIETVDSPTNAANVDGSDASKTIGTTNTNTNID
jgi:hypothetical protein